MHHPDSVWEFSTADRIKFGRRAAAELGDELAARGVEGLLVVTDEQLREAGVVDTVLDSVGEGMTVDVFDGVEPDPDVGIPSGLAELGVEESDVPRLAEKTEEIQRLLVGNPRRVDREDLEAIFRDALW